MGRSQGRTDRESRYRIVVDRVARKAIGRLSRQDQYRIIATIDGLATDPLPNGCEPVKTADKGSYRVRVGDYRIVYVVLSDEGVIVIARVSLRNEKTYRGL